jgi:hypothetical protein
VVVHVRHGIRNRDVDNDQRIDLVI